MRDSRRSSAASTLPHPPSGEATPIGALAVGLVLAQAAFALTFRGPRARFWQRMTGTGLALGGYALAVSPPARRVRIGAREVALGVGAAAALYAVFGVGDRVARRFVPGGERQIGEIYSLAELRPRSEIALRLALIVAPAEELFWRGLVQSAFAGRLGRWRGAGAGAAAYGAVHVVTGNFTLFGAATVAGLFWASLSALGMPIGALVVSHIAWDLWIFLVRPTQR
jgi:membrane protease YdiL (CAAX protease family)